MRLPRAAGIVLHPTSLPGPDGIGSLGADAYRFVDLLEASGLKLWQILPLGPTGYGDSPYASHSAFAGNMMLIDLSLLEEAGWLTASELGGFTTSANQRVDFSKVVPAKMAVLRNAFARFRKDRSAQIEVDRFALENRSWLDDYALFMALKDHHNLASWEHWEPDLRFRRATSLRRWAERLHDDIQFHVFVQAVFDRQWSLLKQYANARGVFIVGDMPIFVAYDSVDVWVHADQFCLDAQRLPEFVAGVPPDYFSPTGQLWGNPQYRWDVMQADGFGWWIDRFRVLRQRVDIIRLDHFRGFAGAWWIPHGQPTAEVGEWIPSPGKELFEAVARELGEIPIIAEDLGVITPDVVELKEELGYPGMKVLQFAFGTDASNASLPHNYEQNTCVYTGTHDNDTSLGWFDSIDGAERRRIERYLGEPVTDIAWQLIRLAMASAADTAIFPMQDVLRRGSQARMNSPGSVSGNWQWRFRWEDIGEGDIGRLRLLAETFGRAAFRDVESGQRGRARDAEKAWIRPPSRV